MDGCENKFTAEKQAVRTASYLTPKQIYGRTKQKNYCRLLFYS